MFSAVVIFQRIYATALLAFATVDRQAIAQTHGSSQPYLYPLRSNVSDRPECDAAFRGVSAGNQPLVVVAFQPARRESTRERQFHFAAILFADCHGSLRDRLVNRFTVVARDVGNILGRLQAPFDFQ